MPARHFVLDHEFPQPIRGAHQRLRQSLQIPHEFPAQVRAEAEQVVREGHDTSLGHADMTGVEFVTIDPPDSMDLDQALHIEREGAGYLVRYAIADVAAWVRPGGAIDAEAQRRGQTYYAPHQRCPLHPPSLSEAAASLLADGVARPAQVWSLHLDASGVITGAGVERALVSSRAKLNYADAQAEIEAGTAAETLMLLARVGALRHQIESERGGVSLRLPDQQVEVRAGGWHLVYRQTLPVENWNAQISLMTGYSAAALMLGAGVGLLRTLPPADQRTIQTLRTVATSLGLSWAPDMGYADFVQSLDPTRPQDQAMMMACVRLFRGAGYTVIEPGLSPEQTIHGALAENYAHVTAPLRRLVDRHVGEICLAVCQGSAVPDWVLETLPRLPQTMRESDRRARAFERGVTDMVEALVLSGREGEVFSGVVIQVDEKRENQGVVSLTDPAVEGAVRGTPLTLGAAVQVVLEAADLAEGKVQFRLARG